ncbi:MAG TPA: 50S ribosome-binding GTPase [Methanocorpusculum sp.]|nr:50S ribosome-binding GTPase [Methanocorpusculum sp.]
MNLNNIPTIPTADELLDRILRRTAKKMRKSEYHMHIDENIVQTITKATHDKLVSIIQNFPDFESLPPFYRGICDIMFGMDDLRKALGMVGWAAKNVHDIGGSISRGMRRSDNPLIERKRAIARIASIVHRADDSLRYLNVVRNTLRKLPAVNPDEFTVVVAGYPNVGKSSFIKIVSTAEPEIASYPFTTTGVIVGHRDIGHRERIQFIDTPGILDRVDTGKYNNIEKQALNALVYVADLVLFVIDASEHCGYSIDLQIKLKNYLSELVKVPMIVTINKSDLMQLEGYINMSTITKDGIDAVINEILRVKNEIRPKCKQDIRSALPIESIPQKRSNRSKFSYRLR